MTALSPWLGKVAAFGLLFGLVGVAGLYGGLPLWQRHQQVELQIGQAEELIERFAQARDKKAAFETRIAELRSRQSQSGVFVAGETDAVAGADLQQRVKAAVDGAGGQLKSTQILPPQSVEGFERVGVRVAMVGTIESLFQLLYDLESGRPYLLVDNLDVKARRTRRRKNDTAEAAVSLTVRFDLYGYLSPEAGS